MVWVRAAARHGRCGCGAVLCPPTPKPHRERPGALLLIPQSRFPAPPVHNASTARIAPQ